MFSTKDFSKMTNEELLAEEKNMKSLKTPTALFIGMLVGIEIWSATHKGGFITFFLLFLIIFLIYRSSQNQKNMEAELKSRNL